MTTTTRILGLALTAALAFAATPLTGADAAGRDYGTVLKLETARLEACKVPVQGSDKVRIYARLDNTRSRRADDFLGKVIVLKDGKRTSQRFSSGYTKGGDISEVGVVVARTDGHSSLEVSVSARQFGSGANVALRDVRRC